jgi:hypothetical protein
MFRNLLGAAKGALIRAAAVNSIVGLRVVSEPRRVGVATGSRTHLAHEVSTIRVSGWVKDSTSVARFAGSGS